MKIGVVTTYDEINFGAFLQAYSLVTFLTLQGHDVQLVRYKSKQYRLAELKATYLTKDIFYLIKIISKSIKFHKLIKNLPTSPALYHPNDINHQQFDLLIYGSDEIWNLENCLGGIVDNYYFGGSVSVRKISYAPSFGSTSLGNEKLSGVRNDLLSFSSLSVRDDNSGKILKSIGLDSDLVLDPTFLVNQPIAKVKKISKSKYLFYYFVSSNEVLDGEILKYALDRNLEIISFGYKHSKFRSIINIDPFEWLFYLKNSDAVATNMYHGTIFSLKFSKNLVVDLTEYRKNKLGFLLFLLGAEKSIYKAGQLQAILDEGLDYELINRRIDHFLVSSKKYLTSSLSKI